MDHNTATNTISDEWRASLSHKHDQSQLEKNDCIM